MRFRRLLVDHDLTRKLFDEIGTSLRERGLMMKQGTVADATTTNVQPVLPANLAIA